LQSRLSGLSGRKGLKYELEAAKEFLSMAEQQQQRTVLEYVYGVWPEACILPLFQYRVNPTRNSLSAKESRDQWSRIVELVKLTRGAIDVCLKENPKDLKLREISIAHFKVELWQYPDLIYYLCRGSQVHFALAEELIPIVDKRQGEILKIFKKKHYPIEFIDTGKKGLLRVFCWKNRANLKQLWYVLTKCSITTNQSKSNI
jgi:hypothetical protein